MVVLATSAAPLKTVTIVPIGAGVLSILTLPYTTKGIAGGVSANTIIGIIKKLTSMVKYKIFIFIISGHAGGSCATDSISGFY